MNHPEDYMRAFAELVAQCVTLTQDTCRPKAKGEVDTCDNLLEKLRAAYGERIKALNARDYGRHEVLERSLGQYFGALVTHLSAVSAKWQQVQNDARNPLLDLNEVSQQCAGEALTRALQISEAAYAYAANLERADNELLGRVQLFTQQLDRYVRDKGLSYMPCQYSDWAHESMGISGRVSGHGKIVCTFLYWDGADAISQSLDGLFRKQDDIDAVKRIAALCFAGKAKLADDLSTVELAQPIALVKISQLR
jgi:hypothetical protein